MQGGEMARFQRLKRWEFKLWLCACESNCVWIQGVHMCGCMHNAWVTGLCRWLLCVCMHVYICKNRPWRPRNHNVRIRFAVCVQGCVLCFLYMALHAD